MKPGQMAKIKQNHGHLFPVGTIVELVKKNEEGYYFVGNIYGVKAAQYVRLNQIEKVI